MSRHKSGEEGLNILEHAAKNENDLEAKDKFNSVFNTFLLCPLWSIDMLIKREPKMLTRVIKDMLETARGCGMGSLSADREFNAVIADEIKLKELRGVLVAIIQQSDTNSPNKTLALRLLFRLGYIFASSHDLLLAAEL